jgi:hypothetical protein
MASNKPEIKVIRKKNELGGVNTSYIFPVSPPPPWYKRYWKAIVPALLAIIAAIGWAISNYSNIKEIKNDISTAAENQKTEK